jgi:hypothetical protein
MGPTGYAAAGLRVPHGDLSTNSCVFVVVYELTYNEHSCEADKEHRDSSVAEPVRASLAFR